MHLGNMRGIMTTPRKPQVNVEGEGCATLDVWQVFHNSCTFGIYFGIVTAQRKLEFNVERKVLLPLMCCGFQVKMYIWGMLRSSDDTKKVPISCRREGVATLDVW